MNKIFKVIWSKSKQCYVVVSEMAKNTTGKKKIVVAGILASLAVTGNIVQVEAGQGALLHTSQQGAIAIYDKGASTANPVASQPNAIAIGQESVANGRGGVAIGNEAKAVQNAFAGG